MRGIVATGIALEEVFVFLLTWAVGILLLLVLLYFVSRHNLWFRRYGMTLFMVFLVLGFTVYFWGYFWGCEGDKGSMLHAVGNLFLALFSAGRIFVVELDIGTTQAAEFNELYRAVYGVVMFAAMLLLVVTVLANVGGGIIGRIRLMFLRTLGSRHNVYLIYGSSDEAVHMVKDIYRKDRGSTVLLLSGRDETADEEERKCIENEAFRYGAFKVSFTDDKRQPFVLRIAKRCQKNTYVLCMSKERWKNVRLLREICTGDPACAQERLHFYVLHESEKSSQIADQSWFKGWDVHWADPEQMTARQVMAMPEFLEICPEDWIRDGRADETLRLAVIGYSRAAEELCRYLVTGVQTTGMRVQIHMFGKDLKQEMAYFQAANPGLSAVADLQLREEEPGSHEFYQFFGGETELPQGIFCTGPDTEENAKVALRLAALARRSKRNSRIFALGRSVCEDKDVLCAAGIVAFGCMEQIYSYDILIGEELDAMAKAVHRYYKKFYGEEAELESLWKQAGLYEKLSSRALAVHIPWKLRCAGFEVTCGPASGAFSRALEENPRLQENLSRGEHSRWEASLFCDGWQSAAPEELPQGRNKDPETKRHACLVPWEELPEVSAYYGTDYQYLDTHLVKALEDILDDAGYSVRGREKFGSKLPNLP